MPDPMSARSLLTAIEIDRAAEIVEKILTSQDPDEIADALDDLLQGGEVTHAVCWNLISRIRGWPIPSGIEMANQTPTIADLILPPGASQ